MKTIVMIILLVLFSTSTQSQNVKVDSLFYLSTDTIIDKERKENLKLYALINGEVRLLMQEQYLIIDKKVQSKYWYPPRIKKAVYNENEGIVYDLAYWEGRISICRLKIDGTTQFKCPYEDDTKEFWDFYDNLWLSTTRDICSYFTGKFIKLKDIDFWIENNIMYVRCYKPKPQIMSFHYDFGTREWSKLEVRDLSEEEIAECGLYETENK